MNNNAVFDERQLKTFRKRLFVFNSSSSRDDILFFSSFATMYVKEKQQLRVINDYKKNHLNELTIKSS